MDTVGQGTLLAAWWLTGAAADKPMKIAQDHLARSGPSPRGNPQAIATTLSALIAEFSQELTPALVESAQTGL